MKGLPYAQRYLNHAAMCSALPTNLQLPERLLTWDTGSTKNGNGIGAQYLSLHFILLTVLRSRIDTYQRVAVSEWRL